MCLARRLRLPKRANAMLKISVIETKTARRLVLEGRLVAPWAAELRRAARKAETDLANRELLIDVKGLTAISTDGEDLLLDLIQEGARFRRCGVFMKQIMKQLAQRARQQHKGNREDAIRSAQSHLRE